MAGTHDGNAHTLSLKAKRHGGAITTWLHLEIATAVDMRCDMGQSRMNRVKNRPMMQHFGLEHRRSSVLVHVATRWIGSLAESPPDVPSVFQTRATPAVPPELRRRPSGDDKATASLASLERSANSQQQVGNPTPDKPRCASSSPRLSPASNRCAKLGVSGSLRLGATAANVVTVTFAADNVSSPERRSGIEESWRLLIVSACNGHVGPRHSHAVWLENNAILFAISGLADVSALNTTSTSKVFLAWDEDHYNSRRVEDLCDGLRASLLSSHGIEPAISAKAVRLANQVQRSANGPPQQPAISLSSLPSILKAGVSPTGSADFISLRRNAFGALQSSVRDARAGTRQFPAPSDSFISQGELYEGNMPALPQWRITHEAIESYHVMDLVWMQLNRLLSLRVHGPRIQRD